MKAIVCNSYGPISALSYQDLPDPILKSNQVLIDVKACSVNFPDTLIVQGLYQFKPDTPFAPGSDVAGIISAVGEDVKNYKIGDEVIAMSGWGGFAEKVAVNANVVFPKPPKMSMVQAASFLLAYGTSFHALRDRGQLKEGDTLVVLGASGGVGLTAVELGKRLGARVIACASTADKLALCKEYGADETINYASENLKERIKELTNGKGADVIYDPVGGDYSEQAIRAIAWEGRYLVVGFAAGDIPKLPLNLPLLKSCQIVGVFWGAYAQKFPENNFKDVLQLVHWLEQGDLKPHIHKIFKLEEGAEALEYIAQRKAMGKLVIKI